MALVSAPAVSLKAAAEEPAGMQLDAPDAGREEREDLYTRLKTLQRQLEFLDIQVRPAAPDPWMTSFHDTASFGESAAVWAFCCAMSALAYTSATPEDAPRASLCFGQSNGGLRAATGHVDAAEALLLCSNTKCPVARHAIQEHSYTSQYFPELPTFHGRSTGNNTLRPLHIVLYV